MVRTQVQLTEQQVVLLKKLALVQGVSLAELVRQGVEALLAQAQFINTEEKKRRALSVVGKYSSHHRDLATKHDDYFAEDVVS